MPHVDRRLYIKSGNNQELPPDEIFCSIRYAAISSNKLLQFQKIINK